MICRIDEDIIVKWDVKIPPVSDHFIVACKLDYIRPSVRKVSRTFRSFRDFDNEHFSVDLKESLSNLPTSDDVNELVAVYTEICTSLLDKYAPFTTKTVSVCRRLPWYNEEIRQAKRLRRRLERKWRKSGSLHDHSAYLNQVHHVNDLILQAKTDFFKSKIVSASSKDLFHTVKGLLNRSGNSLPVHDSASDLATKFAMFFKSKVDKISADFDTCYVIDTVPHDSGETTGILQCFKPVSVEEVEQVMSKLSNKTCDLDPLPTWILKQNISVVSPVVTRIVNASMVDGIFPDAFKEAIVTPILKKQNLDVNVLKNFRPISNIQFLAKVTESVVASRLKDHLSHNGLHEDYQSAYRTGHSTETALLKVKSDILRELDNNRVVLMVMLDLTAAFDTINHNILINRLHTTFNVSDAPLNWFKSYMTSRSSRVCIDNCFSDYVELSCGTPQGSIMGPLQFTLYIHPVGKIIRDHGLDFHLYADDSQIYVSFDPKIPGDCLRAMDCLQNCIKDLSNCMATNHLKLNMDKTEFIIFGSPHNISSHKHLILKVGDTAVKPSNSVRNLGVNLDSNLSMDAHISRLCQTLNFQLRNIARIRRFLDKDTCHHVVRALVLSRLDYANSLLAGTTEINLTKLQRLQNKAVRLIHGINRREHITPYLADLHWLPVRERVNFKICTIIYQCINGSSTPYLQNDIHRYTTANSLRTLRSATDTTRLKVPFTHRSHGDRAFTTYGPRVWNSLPRFVREATSLSTFKTHLKTHLFQD